MEEVESKLDKNKEWQELKKACLIDLAKKTELNVVFGEGNLDSEIMIVGLRPSVYGGDKTLRPLIDSKSGKFMKEVFNSYNFNYEKIYRTNLVKFANSDNQKPSSEEIDECKIYLEKEIAIIRPKIILSLGGEVSAYFKGERYNIIFMNRNANKPFYYNDYIIIPTFHPSYILRGGGSNKSYDITVNLINEILKGGHKITMSKKSKTKEEGCDDVNTEADEKNVKKQKKYDDEVEKKIIALAKQSKTPSEISKEFNGHPAVPKIKRVLLAAGISVKKKE